MPSDLHQQLSAPILLLRFYIRKFAIKLKIMIKIVSVLMTACVINSFAYAQLKTPQPSPTQTIKQNFGLSSIELSYSRPGKKGRKIVGDLVPFGNVWRTGANQATTLTFGDEVTNGVCLL